MTGRNKLAAFVGAMALAGASHVAKADGCYDCECNTSGTWR